MKTERIPENSETVTIFEFESDDFHKRCHWTSQIWGSKRVEEAPATATEVARRRTGDKKAARGRHAPDCSEQRRHAWRRVATAGGVGCRAKRRFRSGGFRTELRQWTTADGGGRWRTAADSDRGCRQWRTESKCCLQCWVVQKRG